MAPAAGLYRIDVGYESRSLDHWNLSPVYVTCKAAKRLIDGGHQVTLPPSYTVDTLEHIMWLTGYIDRRVKISARQLEEVARIGSTLLEWHHPMLTLDERSAINQILEILRGDDTENREGTAR